jgi:hypothetical protein
VPEPHHPEAVCGLVAEAKVVRLVVGLAQQPVADDRRPARIAKLCDGEEEVAVRFAR